MSGARNEFRRPRFNRRGISLIELSLTLCVISGLLFVSVRILSLDLPINRNQTIVAEQPPLNTGGPP